MTSALDLWRGEFGNAYTDRNWVDWRSRRPFWGRILNVTGARSVLEIGCNAGWNLSAIKAESPDVRVAGTDINPHALEQAHAAGLEVYECLDFRKVPGKFDLVFTAGVLIHVEPDNIGEMMDAAIEKSFRWVAAIEYECEVEEVVPYRGYDDKCWRRPYGQMYRDRGLSLHASWNDAPGFDRCTAWLLKK